MFKLIAIALLTVSCSGYPFEQDSSEESKITQIRQVVGGYRDSTYNNWENKNFDSRKVKFFLYTGQEPRKLQLQTSDLLQSLKNSSYDVKRPVKILIHDWLLSEDYNKELIAAFVRHNRKPVDVITVDYSYYSSNGLKTMVKMYGEIGEAVAKLMKELKNYGTMGDKMHIIGHGIGAHIAAVAARKIAPFRIERITGLNPTGLVFDKDFSLTQLEKHDADFVDIISSNMGEVGSTRHHRGHVNFYPSGGVSHTPHNQLENHLKAYFYYVESVARGKVFMAYESNSYSDFKNGQYNHEKYNYMGELCLKNKTGEFYLDVNSYPPYSTTNDDHYQPNKQKMYETYFSWFPKTQLQPWGTTAEEKSFFKTMNVQDDEQAQFGKMAQYITPIRFSSKPRLNITP